MQWPRSPRMLAVVASAAATLLGAEQVAHAQARSPEAPRDARADGPSALPSGPALSWRELAERQRRENVTLLAARHRLEQARAEVIAAGVWTNPQVSANALVLTHGAVTGGQQELFLGIDQLVPLAGQVGLRKDVARELATAEERAFAASAWQVLNDARVAHLELQRAQARARLVEGGLADLGRVAAIVGERAAGGAATAYDKIRVGVERSKVEARLADARVDVVGARAALALLVGKSVDAATLTVEDGLPEARAPLGSDDELVRRALAARPEVTSADARVSASEIRISLLRRLVIPSPTLSVGYARYFDVPEASFASGGALLAGVSVPVPVLDRGQGRIDRGIAEAAEQRALKQGVALTVRREVEQAAATLRVRLDAFARFRRETAPDVPRLRGIAELAYREGRATILELLDAYNAYLDAQDRQLQLQASAARAALDLERALGPAR